MSVIDMLSAEPSADVRRRAAGLGARSARLAAIVAACDTLSAEEAARTVEFRLGALDGILTMLESDLEAAGARVPGDAGRALEKLSEQELRVARLVARGLSNSAIAAELWLSPRTVSSHLYRIFPKLAISSRVELAAFMLRAG